MLLTITKKELQKALKDIEIAESNGFMYCLSVFELTDHTDWLDQNKAFYRDIWERAHPTNGNLNWGRGQSVTVNNQFVDGKLVRIIKNPDLLGRG
jgi:hypothetical protein